jgi:DegV family protein with EDD domain
MIGLVTDSNSQLPPSLAERYGIEVVALPVTIDGREYREGVDLTVDKFYASWDGGHEPVIETSQPSPGDFVETFGRLIEGGATEILSVHVAAAMSGTLNAARLASEQISCPVHLVDTGTASFGVSCCIWAAAEAIDVGASIAVAAEVAERRAADLGTAFIVGVPSLTERSGRADGVGVASAAEEGVPVLAMSGGELTVLDTVKTINNAIAAMTDYALGWTPSNSDGLRIAIGTSDTTSRSIGDRLTDMLTTHPAVGDIVQYRIGPSVGAHTGPGTAGLFVF